MPLDRVLESIKIQTEKEVSRIIGDGRAQAEGILSRAESRATKLVKDRYKFSRKSIRKLRLKESSLTDLMLRKETLVSQREALLLVYEKVKASLAALPSERNEKLLLKMIERVRNELKTPIIYSNSRDAATVKAVAGVEFGGVIDCAGGIIAEEKDGVLRLNLTYDSILDDVWKKCQKDVADILSRDLGPESGNIVEGLEEKSR